MPIEELYVPLTITTSRLSPDTDPDDWELEDPVATLAANRRVVVLGDPGSGKSTLVNWFAWFLAAGLARELPGNLQQLLPIPIVLRDIRAEQITSFADLLAAFMERPIAAGLVHQRDLLEEYLRQGAVLLLVDGLDEIPLAARRRVQEALRTGTQHYPHMRVLCTSRIVGYEDAPLSASTAPVAEAAEAAAVAKKMSDDFKLYYVAPFTDDQISRFALNWYRDQGGIELESRYIRDAFVDAICSTPETLRLARTPNLLTMMALVYRVKAQLPNGRALLYEDIAQAYLESIDNARKLKDEFTWQEKKRWLARVAFEMQFRRDLHGETGERTQELLVQKEEVLAWIRQAMTSSGRRDSHGYAAKYLDWVARRSGLLLPRGEGLFAFMHLSFQEYFAAVYLKQQIENPDWILELAGSETGIDTRITRKALSDWSNKSSWHQTVVFLFELLANQQGWSRLLVGICFPPSWTQSVAEALDAKLKNDPWDLIGNRLPPRADLLAQLLDDPHSGLVGAQKASCLNQAFEVAIKEQEVLGRLDRGALTYANKITLFSELASKRETAPAAVEAFVLSKCDALTLNSVPNRVTSEIIRRVRLRHLWIEAASLRGAKLKDELRSLRRLGFVRTKVATYDWIAELKDLEIFACEQSTLTNIDFLGSCDKLIYLRLQDTKVADISALKSLESLRDVWLDGAKVSDLSALCKLNSLRVLSLHRLPARSIEPISRLPKLDTLWLMTPQVDDLRPLQDAPMLHTLGLFDVRTSSISGLESCRTLHSLFISSRSITDVAAITKSKSLRELSFHDLDPRVISDIEGFNGLRKLHLSAMAIDAIPFTPDLQELEMQNSAIRAQDSVLKLSNLKVIKLLNTALLAPKDLWTLPKLQKLVIDGVEFAPGSTTSRNAAARA